MVASTSLNTINQGDAFANGGWVSGLKTALTYCVPFLVTTYGARHLMHSMEARRGSEVTKATGETIFTGPIPALYDRFMGPMLFRLYAAGLARRLDEHDGGRVLEIAAGTGIVTEALIEVLPPAVEIVATDLNQAMVDFAAAKPGMTRVPRRTTRSSLSASCRRASPASRRDRRSAAPRR